jgi:para-nitrobenzyl esterase
MMYDFFRPSVVIVAVALWLFAETSWAAIQAEDILVQTKSGPVIGESYGGLNSFKGIPYAASTAKDGRFAPPKEPVPWTEPLQAKSFGPVAWQVPVDEPFFVLPEGSPMSENCLNLNIWTPAGVKADAGLPVYVFIHGGGFGLGAGSQPMYDGGELAKMGLLVVTLNYRLGAEGFLPTRETFNRYGTTGNWGLLDQIKALEWVRDNIRAFGGDPTKVTIGGESAGSISVSALIVSPLAKGLFRGAIMESGTVMAVYNAPNNLSSGDLDKAIAQGGLIMSSLSLDDAAKGRDALMGIDPLILARLTPFNANWTKFVSFGLFPVRDGRVIPKDPQAALAKGDFNQVKILIGFNHDEGSIFVPEVDESVLSDMLMLTIGPEAAEAFSERYPPDASYSSLDRARQAMALAVFTAGTKRVVDLHSSLADVYLYEFQYVSPYAKANGLGACHTAELEFVFGHPSGSPSQAERKLGEDIRSRWVNFIKTGDPNQGEPLPTPVQWPLYDPVEPQALRLDLAVTAGSLDFDALDFMADQLYGPRPVSGDR